MVSRTQRTPFAVWWWTVDRPLLAALGAIEIQPERLCAQLADGGRLVCIRGTGPAAKATLYRRDLDDISCRAIFDAAGPQLPGFAKPAAFVF